MHAMLIQHQHSVMHCAANVDTGCLLPCLSTPCLVRDVQAPAVRNTAADNLGELTRLSARVEQLVGDLASNAASTADPDTAAAYLTALRGALRASGDRLTPATLDKVQGQLLQLYKTLSGKPTAASAGVDAQSAALVRAMAQYCAAAGAGGLSVVLSAGPLGPAGISGSKETRELGAMLLAAVAGAAAEGLEEAGQLRSAVEAAVKATRDTELVSWLGRQHGSWAVLAGSTLASSLRGPCFGVATNLLCTMWHLPYCPAYALLYDVAPAILSCLCSSVQTYATHRNTTSKQWQAQPQQAACAAGLAPTDAHSTVYIYWLSRAGTAISNRGHVLVCSAITRLCLLLRRRRVSRLLEGGQLCGCTRHTATPGLHWSVHSPRCWGLTRLVRCSARPCSACPSWQQQTTQHCSRTWARCFPAYAASCSASLPVK